MKLQALIMGLFLAAGIFAGAQNSAAWIGFSGAKSPEIAGEVFHSHDFKPGVPAQCPAGASTGSPGSETANDCCAGSLEYDPVTAARAAACKLQLLVSNFYAPVELFALQDPSYPIIKPPQKQTV